MKKILKLMVWVMLLGLPVVMTSCDLGFFDNPVSPDLKVLKPSITVQVGKSYRCNVHASTKAKLTFTSADPSIATVDSYGVVTGVKTGKTTIAVKTSGVDDFYNSIFYVETATIDVEVIKLDVPVKSVKLDKTTLTATLGDDPVKLVATVNPDNADFKTVEWTTSDETIVEVEDGVMTFVGAGTATITATATNGTTDAADDKTAKCEVTVNGISVTSVTLDKTELAMTVGSDDVTLTATVAPDNATDKTVTWTSSNEAAATVENGVVHAVAAGTATITAKAGAKTATCTVTVNAAKVNVTSVTLSETSLEKKVGDAVVTLTATVGPEDATDKTVTWSSDKPAVASVNNGEVSILSEGTATITCTATNGTEDTADDKTATCTVTVKYPGLLAGKFSVSATQKVRFSQGNLQATYNGTLWSWAFAENQWDYIGDGATTGNRMVTNADPYISGPGTVDLFGWVGASSIWTGAAQYGITSADNITYLGKTNGYGNKNGSEGETLKSDWGTLPITNGGNTANYGWRTLTGAEWAWILGKLVLVVPGTNCRVSGSTANGTSDARFTFATINTDDTPVNGLIIFPDGVTIANGEATSWGNINATSSWANSTKCTTAQWTALAAKGCVFLPAAGQRGVTTVSYSGTSGRYWSSSPDGTSKTSAMYLSFQDNAFLPNYSNSRHAGCSVRLVRDAE